MATLQQTLSPMLLSPSSATITNNISLFDNSDQGSVDSDYTSLGSSKFYGNSGSTSSLHHQGRSQSIDELASSTTNTTIPTRHFNGVLNLNKTNADPLQFVKIHPNHDLIERAQEQLLLAESRKRIEENYKLKNKIIDEENDWSKAVENWRQKREQKRLKNVNSSQTDNDRPISPVKIEPILKTQEIKKLIDEPVPKPLRLIPSPPIVQFKSKSPSPLRNKGSAKIREISMEKPVDVRGFGFKLDGGRTEDRPIYISTIEEGSPADKAGLCIDDEVISMNDENIENLTFDQVRKILKERNLRGSIKLVVKTYEDILDDNSQTVVSGPTTDRSRTPSPQKPIYSRPSTTSPVPDSTKQQQQQTPSSSLNIFAPKPFRSTNTEPQNNPEPTTTTTATINENQQPNIPLRIVVNTPQPIIDQPPPPPPPPVHGNIVIDNKTEEQKQRDESPIAQVRFYVEKQMDQLQQDLEFGFSRGPKISPQSHLTPPAPEQRPVNIPVDTKPLPSSSPPQEFLRSSLKKSSVSQNELDQIPSNRAYGFKVNPNEQIVHYLDPYPQQRPSSSYTKRSIPDLPSMTTIHRPSTAHTIERTFNELRINMPNSYSSQPQIINQQQKKVTIQLDAKVVPPPRTSSKQLQTKINQVQRKAHFEDQVWINDNQKQQINGRRSAPHPQHQQDLQRNRQMMCHQSRNGQQRNFDVTPNKQHRTRSPIRSNDRVLSVSGRLRCSRCSDELGQGSAMVIESLGLYYHIECFRCCVCNIPLSSSLEGTDVRVRSNRLHCQNCFSDENGVKLSAV